MGKLHTLVKLSWFGLEWYTLFNEPSLLLVDEPHTRHFTLTNRPALRVVPPVGPSGTPKGLRGKKATRRQRRQRRLQKKQSKREELPVDEYYQEKPKKNSRKNRKRKASKAKSSSSSSKKTTVIPSPIPLPSEEDEDYYYATHQPTRLRPDQTEVFVGFPSDDEDELDAQNATATSQPTSSLETEKIQRLEDELKRLREALTTLNDGLANQKKNEEKQHPQMMMWPQWNGSMYLPVPPPNTSSFLTPIDHESANRFRRIPAFQFSDDEDDNGPSNNRRFISSSSSSSSSSYTGPSERDLGFVDLGSFVPVPTHSPPPPPPPSAQSPETFAALSPARDQTTLRSQEEKKMASSPSVISKSTKVPPPPPPMPSSTPSSSSINKSSGGIPAPPPMMAPSSSAATPKRFSLMSPEPRAKVPAQSTPSSSAAMSSLLSDPKVWEQKLSSLRRVTEEDREKMKKQREKEKMVATTTRPLSAADMIASALARKFQFARGSPPSSPESSSDWDSPSEKENGSPSKVGPRKLVITDLTSSPLKRSFSPIRSLSPSTTSSSPFSRVPSSTSQLHVFSDASSGAMAITDS